MGCVQSNPAANAVANEDQEDNNDIATVAFKQSDDENQKEIFDLTTEYPDDLMKKIELIDEVYGINFSVTKKKSAKHDHFHEDKADGHDLDFDFTRSNSNADASKALEELGKLGLTKQINALYQHYYKKFRKAAENVKELDDQDDEKSNMESEITKFCVDHLNNAINGTKTAKAISAGLCQQFGTGIGYPEEKSGIEIDLSHFTNAACDIDTTVLSTSANANAGLNKLVKCESGVTVHDIESQYWANIYTHHDDVTLKNASGQYYTCLPNRGGSDQLSLVGLSSVGAMGYGNNNPNINGPQFGGIQNVIVSLRAMTIELNQDTGVGEIKYYQIEESVSPGAEGIHDKTAWDAKYPDITLIQDDLTFNNWVTSIGTYGVITHVFVTLEDAKFYIQHRQSVDVDKWEKKYHDICADDDVYKFEMYFVPYSDLGHKGGYCVYNTFRIAPPSVTSPDSEATITKYGGVTRSSDTFVPRAAAAAIVLIANCDVLKALLLPPALGLGLNATITKKPLTMTSVRALNFETGNLIKTNTMGMAFPAKDANGDDNVVPLVNSYRKFMREQGKSKNYWATSPVALRFAKKSNGTVSAAGDYDIAWLEQPMVKGTDKTIELLDNNFFSFWQKQEKAKINFGMYFPSKDLPTYAWDDVSNYESFRAMYKKYNSGGKFCNQFTADSGLDQLVVEKQAA